MNTEPQTENHPTNTTGNPLGEDEAIAMLPEGDYIHTFRSDIPNMLLGADWSREKIVALIKEKGAHLSGPMATQMNHGLHVRDGRGNGLFIATSKPV